MKGELLHIVDCPNTAIAEANARAALDAAELAEVPIELVTIHTETEAANTRFGGSPTILVDGVDLFPTQPVRSLACRVYATERGYAGAPTPSQIEEALHETYRLRRTHTVGHDRGAERVPAHHKREVCTD